MLTDLARAARLTLVRHFFFYALFSTIAVSFVVAELTRRFVARSPADETASLALLLSLWLCLAVWFWAWQRLPRSLDADFEGACARLGGSLLSERTRVRLRESLNSVLPHHEGSVLRAFRARVGGTDLFIVEWSANGLTDAILLADVQLVVVLPDCATTLPVFHLEPETPVTRLSEWLHARQVPGASRHGSDDIDFKRDPSWSDRWFLCGPQRAALRRVFHRRVRDVFRRVRGWQASGRGRWLVLRTPRAVSARNLVERVREAAELAARFQRAASAA